MSISRIYLNAWRIFLEAEVLWGQMSRGCRHLTLDEFFYCYKPQQITVLKGFYNFVVCKLSLKLVSSVHDSNRDWKSRYFLVRGSNWVCRPDEWDSIGEEYDNMWGYFGWVWWVFCHNLSRQYPLLYVNPMCFLFQPKYARRLAKRGKTSCGASSLSLLRRGVRRNWSCLIACTHFMAN